tara:strand:- start:205 stop:309 length:105 start_codon:yes stop_codon:yes gene_type:complete
MPKVGKKKYPYTPQGRRKARKAKKANARRNGKRK